MAFSPETYAIVMAQGGGSGGGGGDSLVYLVNYEIDMDAEPATVTVDKSIQDIISAVDAGKAVFAVGNRGVLSYTRHVDFGGNLTVQFDRTELASYGGTSYGLTFYQITGTSNNGWSVIFPEMEFEFDPS